MSAPGDTDGVRPGDIVVDHDGERWIVVGTSRYARGLGGVGWSRTPGLAVRPVAGGRARVRSVRQFAQVESRRV